MRPSTLTGILQLIAQRFGVKRLAARVGRGYQTLLNELNPDYSTHKLGADLVLPIMHATGDNAPLDWLARERGGVFVDLTGVAERLGNAPSTVTMQCVAATKEFGDVAHVVHDKLQNGGITRDDQERLSKEISECVAALLLLDHMAKRAAGVIEDEE
ncbi:phage regulatory CII family protein [Desulfobaculum senezii]|jgi:hypothetical protein